MHGAGGMTLAVGSVLGVYEVTGKLGQGGMGEVFQATDSRLGRDVAIKILPEAFATDAERLARFEREARLLATLNHPNIATLFGLEDLAGMRALVMELVDGPTLGERLQKGPIPLKEALVIARQLAEALEDAHERGIVHRDLKPANIKLREDGRVKVLDFGLAKAMGSEAGLSSDPYLERSPTITYDATVTGVILGTAAYMSPEQAIGKLADKRSDIWAFGVVVWEMLSGRRLFARDSLPETLAEVLKAEVDFSLLPPETPQALRRLLARCLERQPKQRLRDIGDARHLIDDMIADRHSADVSGAGGVRGTGGRRPRGAVVAWTVAGLCLLLTAGLLALLLNRPTPAPALRGRFEITLPPGQQLDARYRRALAVAPDGRSLAVITSGAALPPASFRASDRQISLRALDGWTFRPLPDTQGATDLAYSPDGRWLAFHVAGPRSSGQLFKMPVDGGPRTTLCNCPGGFGLSWSVEGWIAIGQRNGPLLRVDADGGDPEPMAALDEAGGEIAHRHPHVLPDGRQVVFTAVGASSTVNGRGGDLRRQRVGDAVSEPLLEDAADARFMPPDRLVFARSGVLFSAPFDPKRGVLTGDAAPRVEGVAHAVASGNEWRDTAAAQYDVAVTGLLVYGPGSTAPAPDHELFWRDDDGREQALTLVSGAYRAARLSPDGASLLLTHSGIEQPVELADLRRGSKRRVTFEGSPEFAIWGPGAGDITYASKHEGAAHLYRRNVNDPGGAVERLSVEGAHNVAPSVWTAETPPRLIFVQRATDGASEVFMLRPGEPPQRFLGRPFRASHPELSPDGRWLAYVSDESGQFEVWLRPFDRNGPPHQVSVGRGYEPAWAPDGSAIYYRVREEGPAEQPRYALMRVAVAFAEGEPLLARPERLAVGASDQLSWPVRGYDVARDGRLLMIRQRALDDAAAAALAETQFPRRLHVVLGGFD